MLKLENFLYLCGLLFMVLLSVILVTFSWKFILKTDHNEEKDVIKKNYIFDPDYGRNISPICLFLNKNTYKIPYENSKCHNKTFNHWYLPWVRYELLAKLRKSKQKRDSEESQEYSSAKVLNKTQSYPKNASERPELFKKKAEMTQGDKLKQKPSEILYTVLVALVTLSAMGACWEAFRNKFKRDQGHEYNRGTGGSSFKGPEKDCSLAEFTINRHLRRESQQRQQNHHHGNLPRQASFDVPAKVTQTLIHQSSLDRAFKWGESVSEAITCEELRRNSMPSSPMNGKRFGRNSVAALNTQPSLRTFRRQQSLDVSEETALFDGRKKSRFFLRRH